MKDLIAKFKSADYKQLAIDHGEKLVAGLLAVVLVFALITTNWSPYDRTPEELTEKVDGAKQAIARGTWADSEEAKSGLYSVAAGLKKDQVDQLLTRDLELRSKRVDREQGNYRYLTDLVFSFVNSSDPAEQPGLQAVEGLIATPGRALIAMTAAPQAGMFENGEPNPAETRTGRRKLKKDSTGAAGPGSPMGAESPGFGSGGSAPYDTAPMGMGSGMGSGMGAGGTDAEAVRFVAVRGIVPLYRQIDQIRLALHLTTHREAAALVDYWDFHLERRSKPLGAKQAWSEYERVDIRTAQEMLRNSAGWDPELIELSLTDPVLTMSLPTRVLYNWGQDEVSHPKVDNYVLPPSLRERQMLIHKEIIERQIKAAGSIREQEKRGFSPLQQGNRQFSAMIGPSKGMSGMNGMNGIPYGQTSTLISQIVKSMGRDNPEKATQEILAQIMRNQTAAGRLLLFRYLDFDVKPGTTYQYRVQLVLANPNFGAPQQSVTHPEITVDRFLTTPFSQPTAAVSVPNDVNFYVTKVDNAKGSATFDVYQWSTRYGTIINKQLKVLFGSFVGSRTKADVVDPAGNQYLEDLKMDFKSDDVLVDIFGAPNSIDLNEHPDLNVLSREKLKYGLGISQQALLVNSIGELKAFDPVTMFRSYAATKQLYIEQQEDLDSIMQNGAATSDDGSGLSEDYDSYGSGGGTESARGKSSRRGSGGNSLRRQESGYPGGLSPDSPDCQ